MISFLAVVTDVGSVTEGSAMVACRNLEDDSAAAVYADEGDWPIGLWPPAIGDVIRMDGLAVLLDHRPPATPTG